MLQEFFADTQTLSPQRSTLFTGTPLGYTEGAHIYRREGYYYLMVAEGGTSYEHAVVVLRAKNIDGPYELHPDVTMMTRLPWSASWRARFWVYFSTPPT